MVAAGIWFGLVVAFGVWRFAANSWLAVAVVVATTWAAWEVAVNLTMQITDYALKISALPDTPRYYLGGFVGGMVGALLTWAGAALFSLALRGRAVAASVAAAGALLGLLLPWSMSADHPAILLCRGRRASRRCSASSWAATGQASRKNWTASGFRKASGVIAS